MKWDTSIKPWAHVKCSLNRSHHYYCCCCCCCCCCVVIIIIISRKKLLLWRQSHCLPYLPLYPHNLGQCLGYNQCSANTWRTKSQSPFFLESWLFSPCVISRATQPTVPKHLDTRIVTRASCVPGDQAKGLILHWFSCLRSPHLLNSLRRKTRRSSPE